MSKVERKNFEPLNFPLSNLKVLKFTFHFQFCFENLSMFGENGQTEVIAQSDCSKDGREDEVNDVFQGF